MLDLLLPCFLGVGSSSIVIRPCDVVPCEVEREERGEYSEAHDEATIIIATEKAVASATILIRLSF